MSQPILMVTAIMVSMIFIIGIFAWLSWFFNQRQQKMKAAWSAAAEATRMAHSTNQGGEGFETIEQDISGEVANGLLQLSWMHSHATTAKYSLQGRVDFASPLGLGLDVSAKGLLSFGTDLKSGDQSFDEAFVVRARDDKAVLKLMTLEVRSALLELGSLTRGLKITDEGIRFKSFSPLKTQDSVQSVVQAMISLSDGLARAHSGLGMMSTSEPSDRRTLPSFEDDDLAELSTQPAEVGSKTS